MYHKKKKLFDNIKMLIMTFKYPLLARGNSNTNLPCVEPITLRPYAYSFQGVDST